MSEPLFQAWMATVGRGPRAVAVVEAERGRTWSRAELAAGAAGWARSFRMAAGDDILLRRRVALSVPNGAGWFEAFLGLLSLGAVPAPFDPTDPEAAQLEAARSIRAAYLWREGTLHRVAGARRSPAGECLVKMTSASTGAPRGLPATHSQMAADGRQVCSTMKITPGDRCLAAVPLGYSYGLGNLVLPLLLQGSAVICASSALPQALAADIARFRPTVFPAVPPILRALAASELPGRPLGSLRLVISAGSPLAPEVASAFAEKFGKKVHGFYGTSETGGIAFDRTGNATLEGRSVGTPLDGVTVTPGRSGRFTVSGAAVLGRGRFSPADGGSITRGGELVLRGRTDRVVKVAGRRVDLAEIERALRSVPGVREAFAHLVAGREPLLAAAAATELPGPELRRLLRARLASWKVPGRIVALARFPVTARGKVDAEGLRQLLSAPRRATSISTLSAERQMSAPR
jgi:long-chain acyl-CoA synthetase